jgi:hypothetical protein
VARRGVTGRRCWARFDGTSEPAGIGPQSVPVVVGHTVESDGRVWPKRSVKVESRVEPMTDGYLWNEASVTYPDMKGTAELDISMAQRPIAHLVGLDEDEWSVIGLDIGGGEMPHHLRVIAIPKANTPDGGDVLPKIAAASGGEVQATEFLIHDANPYEILQAVSHVFELRLRVRRLTEAGIPVRIVAHGDVPVQEEM